LRSPAAARAVAAAAAGSCDQGTRSRGLIERARRHPRHRNVQELHLTEAGQQELDKAERIISDLERHLHDALGAQRHARLRELLDQVIDELPNWHPPA
jgi:DNA-binding MarR family transcriptional regulator